MSGLNLYERLALRVVGFGGRIRRDTGLWVARENLVGRGLVEEYAAGVTTLYRLTNAGSEALARDCVKH